MPVNQAVSTYEGHYDILVSSRYTPFTYTVDRSAVSLVTLPDGRQRNVLPEGQVMALDPATLLAIPHTNQVGVIGPLLQQVDVTEANREATIVWRGDVRLDRIVDNDILGTLTATAESAFGDRIKVHPSNRP